MILVFDIGNTRIKSGLFEDTKLMSTDIFSGETEIKNISLQENVEAVCISSVSNIKTKLIAELCNEKGIAPFIISADKPTGLKIDYDTPLTLGNDRLCSVKGALSIQSDKVPISLSDFIITMDCGTATTINILKGPDAFIGGTISPGISLMFESLHTKTAALPLRTAGALSELIGKSTDTAIISGVINSTIGLLEKIIRYIREDLKAGEINLYVTGGNAEALLNHIKHPYTFEPYLVLHGANRIYQLNREPNIN
ncbi:MAG: type III pantothenate kinase [Ignavibacteriales bacterium]|nr:MAG: type III pantothenate kinase [Ignavibacteriales bacterium]